MGFWGYAATALLATGAAVDAKKSGEHQARLAAVQNDEAMRMQEEAARLGRETAERQAAEQLAMMQEQSEAAAQDARDRANEAARQQAALVQSNQQQKAAIEEAKAAPAPKSAPEIEIRSNVDTARRRRREFSPTSSVRI